MTRTIRERLPEETKIPRGGQGKGADTMDHFFNVKGGH